MISEEKLQNTAEDMLRSAATRLPQDVIQTLKNCRDREEKSIAKKQFKAILRNVADARENERPICQDTGLPVFLIKTGIHLEPELDLKRALERAIQDATEKVPLRPNVVKPLSRKNSGNNTGEDHPLIHVSLREDDDFEMELMLKGAGSENWSRLYMLNPTAEREDIIEKVVGVVEEAGGQMCPPGIIGVGIGGTADHASWLAKKALFRPLDEKNDDENLGELETEITRSANDLGIGPMGLGGENTVLATRIEKAGCHTASLPVAVNPQCWAARRAKAILKGGELRIEVPK